MKNSWSVIPYTQNINSLLKKEPNKKNVHKSKFVTESWVKTINIIWTELLICTFLLAFKLNYLFEGNSKTKPEQNLSGSSRKLNRDTLLQVTHEERRKRQVFLFLKRVDSRQLFTVFKVFICFIFFVSKTLNSRIRQFLFFSKFSHGPNVTLIKLCVHDTFF